MNKFSSLFTLLIILLSVSYTHLDVYKRQDYTCNFQSKWIGIIYMISLFQLLHRYIANNRQKWSNNKFVLRYVQENRLESVSYTHLDVYKRQG